MGNRLQKRTRSLGRALRRILLLTLAPLPTVAACRAATDTHARTAPVSPDAGPDVDRGADADAEPSPDAADENSLDADASDADASDADAFDSAACDTVTLDASAYDDASDGCSDFHLLPCGLSDPLLVGCYPYPDSCLNACGDASLFYCQLAPETCQGLGTLVPEASTIVECVRCAGQGGGRRPRGLCAVRASAGTAVGAYFATMAHLEAASVRAFRELASDLSALGAPPHLVRAASDAAGDERRHARVASRLARRFGSAPRRARVHRTARPSLFELLEDDAVEGCVGETFGALLATWQSEASDDPRVRRAMRRIAVDETRHAALAWEVLRWGAPRLCPDDRLRLRRAMDHALAGLRRATSVALDDTARRISGYPSPAAGKRLVHHLGRLVRIQATSRDGALPTLSEPLA